MGSENLVLKWKWSERPLLRFSEVTFFAFKSGIFQNISPKMNNCVPKRHGRHIKVLNVRQNRRVIVQ